ncbi:hypothetical protein INT47_001534 [Mucor saturninus]|uniref:RRM domain-containing protein n=1 Tax=Mucor saturninus TaxID=64648 RepID=A0A8H7QV18_9FUNG|nr:hypothetical protein INT47_001534 [Mucor saturninus]
MMYSTTTDFIHPIEEESLTMSLNLLQPKGSPIRPPTPLTPTNTKLSSYSLFDDNVTSNNSWDWLSSPLFRKHSVQADGHDFSNMLTTATNNDGNSRTNFWRRASEPNTPSFTSVCTSCLNKHTQLFTPSCGQHQFCNSCLTSQSLQLLMQGVCPTCSQTVASNYNITSMHLATKPTSSIAANDYMFQYTYPTSDFRPHSTHYACVKLSNIPWDVSQNDVRHFFGNCRSPSLSVCTQSIHIMMDRTTGKTLSDAYVEFLTVADMRRAIESRNQKPLKGRIVSVNECSQEELLAVVFPKWRGQFHGTLAIPPASEVVRAMSTAAGGGNSGCPPFITREEINSLLVVCKNYKLHFSRKCAERPFENIISVIAKYPWHQSHLITTMHRDHIYEMLKLSIESLKTHLSKDYVQIDTTLLERLTRAGIMCPAFTERQKTTLLQTARIDCPADIESFLIPVATAAAVTAAATTTTAPTTTSVVNSGGITLTPSTPPCEYAKAPLTINTKHSFHPQDHYVWDEEDLMLSPTNSPISSLIRDIQQTCYFDEDSPQLKTRSKSGLKKEIVNNGIPLLLQPIADLSLLEKQQQQQQQQHQQKCKDRMNKPIQQLSPWAPSYAPKTPSDIWRMSTPIESPSKSLLAA